MIRLNDEHLNAVKLRDIGAGSEGVCYFLRGKVYKIFHVPHSVNIFPYQSKFIAFPEEELCYKDVICGYTMNFASGKSLVSGGITGNVDEFSEAITNLVNDISKIKDITFDDVCCENTLLDKNKLTLIDTDTWTYGDSSLNYLKVNLCLLIYIDLFYDLDFFAGYSSDKELFEAYKNYRMKYMNCDIDALDMLHLVRDTIRMMGACDTENMSMQRSFIKKLSKRVALIQKK